MEKLHQRSKSGFTLIELMVALGIMGIVMVLIARTFTAQQRAYFAVDDISETQQNSSIVQTVMDAELRHAGFLVPTAAAVCAMDNVAVSNIGGAQLMPGTDILWVSSSGLDVIDSIGTLLTRKATNGEPLISTDLGARLTSTYVHSTGLKTFVVGSLSIDDPANAAAAVDFAESQGVILVREESQSVLGCGQITGPVMGSMLYVHLFAVSSTNDVGDGDVVIVPANLYYVAPPSVANGNQPTLMRNGMAFVPGVEDLQVAVYVDRNANRIVDAGEYLGGDDGTSHDFFNAIATGYVVVNQVREVRVSFVTRSLSEANTEGTPTGHVQSVENHVVGGAPDRFVRRVVSTTAWLRNVAERI